MKKLLPWLIASSAVILALPWLAVTFIKGDDGVAACFILFFCAESHLCNHFRNKCGKGFTDAVGDSDHYSGILSCWNTSRVGPSGCSVIQVISSHILFPHQIASVMDFSSC